MATRSSPRLSRLRDRAVVIQRQLISFSIHQTGFLLPLEWVYRAVVFAPEHVRAGQVHFADGSLPLIDGKHSLFGAETSEHHHPGTLASKQFGSEQQRSKAIAGLILQQPGNDPQWVLPIEAAPTLCRIPDDCFVPMPRTYTVQCVKEMTDHSGDYPLHFLLDPLQLMNEAVPVASDFTPAPVAAAVASVAPPASPLAHSDNAAPTPVSLASSPSTELQ